MRYLAIDPSVMNRAGWATLDVERDANGKLTKEDWHWGCWEINGMNFKMRCTDLKDYIERDIGHFDMLIGEWPCFYAGQKGEIAARQGWTINLAGILMYVAGWFQVGHKKLQLFTAPEWKGTVPKQVTARRFYKLFGINSMNVDHNAIDATMLLYFYSQKMCLTSAIAP